MARFGWAPQDIEAIDRDLGPSGASAVHWERFRDLPSRAWLGQVGAVPGLESSRVARSNMNLAHPAEMPG